MSDLCQFPDLCLFPELELPRSATPLAPAAGAASTLAPALSQAPSDSSPVPVGKNNLSQFPQPKLPLAQALAPSSSQAPMQAQVFDPSSLVPARMEDLSEFSQPDIPLAIPTQALAPPSSQAQVSCPPSCVPEHVMYKNRLQEYTQKTMVHSPIYNTINEGSQHAPRYRSTVFVDGKSFTSPNTFPQKKEAEQNVAQIALDLLSQMMKDEGCPLIHEMNFPNIESIEMTDSYSRLYGTTKLIEGYEDRRYEGATGKQDDAVFCKSILNEYAAKMNLEMPNYTTIQPQGAVPVFASSLVFNGVTYTGDLGTSKKEAERLAARAAIQSLYDDSKSKMVLSKMIKSKRELNAAYGGTKHSYPVGANVAGNSEISNTEHGEALPSGPAHYILSCAIPEACSEVPTPHHLFQIPSAVAGASSAVGNSLISFVPPSTEQQPIAAMSSGKKQRKNKKKANKKPRVDP